MPILRDGPTNDQAHFKPPRSVADRTGQSVGPGSGPSRRIVEEGHLVRIDRVTAHVGIPNPKSPSAPPSSPPLPESPLPSGHLFVRISDDRGRQGIGESILHPPRGVKEEKEPTAPPQTEIETLWAPAILGLSPLERGTVLRSLDEVGENLSIRAAFDLALHDLMGKILEVPVSALLGGVYQRKYSLVGLLPDGDVEPMIEKALELKEVGFDSLKLSVGGDADRDLEVFARLREAVGPEVRLRVGANENYSLVTATRVLKRMEENGLELVEQPLNRTNVEGLAELCSLLDTPVLTTLSLQSPDLALEVISKGATDVVGINCLEAGGLLNAMKIAQMAEAASLPCCVIGRPLGPVGTSADLQLASATCDSQFAIEVPGPLLFSSEEFSPPATELDIRSAEDGFLMVPDRPGLVG